MTECEKGGMVQNVKVPVFLVDHALEGSKVGRYEESDRGNAYVYLSPAQWEFYRDPEMKCSLIDSLIIRMPDGTEKPLMDLQRGDHG